MTGVSPTFAGTVAPTLSEHDRRRIDAALRRIAIGDTPGRWRERPRGIIVTAVLTDGRSGALVLRLKVQHGTPWRFRIAKVSPLAEAAAEWQAFTEIIEPVPSMLCPPIEAVTEGVLDPASALPGEDEAVIYTDVGEFAASAAANLEDLIDAAAPGEPKAVRTAVNLISRLLQLADTVFYNQRQTTQTEQDRLAANRSLGPDLSLLARHIEPVGRPPAAGPNPGGPARGLLPGDVLAAALDLPETAGPVGGADEVQAGSSVALPGLRLRAAGDRLVGEREYISVELLPGDGPGRLTGPPATDLLYSVRGTVTGTRSTVTWERIRRVLPEIGVTAAGTVQVGPTQTAHPYAALRALLTEPVTGLVTGTVHGDLNPRNVLIAYGQPFLIDYARARRDRPILGDFAWLEINLLRHPLSANLSFADLVETERMLALGDRVADVLPAAEHEAVDGALAGLVAPHLRAPILILGAIRRQGRLSYAGAESSTGTSAQPWWREYAAQLLLAAHRTFKWADDLEAEARMRAAVATAAVASEQLTWPDNPWRLWNHASLRAAAAAVLPLLPGRAAALPVLASLVSGLRSLGADVELADEIKRTRVRVVTSAQASASGPTAEFRDAHSLYIDLPASVLEPEQPRPVTSAIDLAAESAQAVVLGASGTGKTALLDELEYRLTDGTLGRFPVRVRASDVAGVNATGRPVLQPLADLMTMTGSERVPVDALLEADAVHLLVDDFDKVPAAGQAEVAGWLRGIRRQYPGTLVTVCHRGAEAPAGLTDWTGILLGEPDDEQIVRYLTRFHDVRGLTSARAATSITAVRQRGLSELARTPSLLWLLASTGNEQKAPVTAGDLVGAYIRGLESRSADSSQWLRCAEALAQWQTASAETASRDEEFLACADPDVTAAWDTAREQLTRLGVLAADGPLTWFRLQIYRDYFAARYLMAIGDASPDQLSALVLRFSWRDAFALLASFSSSGPGVLGDLVKAVADADPCYAARLIRSAGRPPADLTSWFLARQEQRLRDPQAGQIAQGRAAQALAEVASPASYLRLLAILCDQDTDPAAAELSLTALVRGQLAGGAGRGQHRRIAAELGPVLEKAKPPLLTAILRAVGDLELGGLELLVADHLRRSGPWPVVREAREALRKLGARLPAGLAETLQRAQQARLTEVERELPEATSPAAARQLQEERYLLLTADHGAGRLPGLLERRFAFEIGESLADPIDAAAEAAGTGPGPGPAAGSARGILGGQTPTADELLADIVGPDPLAAAAAAHRLLRDRPDLAERLFRTLTENGSTEHSLIAAAAADRLPPAKLPDVVAYFRRLLASGPGTGVSLESAAVLAQVISKRDKQAGVLLVRQGHRFLADQQRADRLRWPWSSALVRFGGTPEQLDTLLSAARAEDRELAIEALASSAFLITGGPPPAHRFSDVARQRLLLACRDTTADRTVVLLRAAAAMSAPEVLDALFAAGKGPSLADAVASFDTRTAQPLTVPGPGLIEIAPAADALAALGYLGRLGSSAGGVACDVHQVLREFDASGGQPSVATGRLIGLGYLGDWPPVLDALGSTDPRMPSAARHALEWWLPGPHTPAGYREPASVASWIAARLARPALPPRVRSVLLELKRSAEEHAGFLTPAQDQDWAGQTPA